VLTADPPWSPILLWQGGICHLICSSAFVAMAITEFTGMPIEAHKDPLDHHTLRRAPSRLLPGNLKEQLTARREAQKRLAKATASASGSFLHLSGWSRNKRNSSVIMPAPDPPALAQASASKTGSGRRMSPLSLRVSSRPVVSGGTVAPPVRRLSAELEPSKLQLPGYDAAAPSPSAAAAAPPAPAPAAAYSNSTDSNGTSDGPGSGAAAGDGPAGHGPGGHGVLWRENSAGSRRSVTDRVSFGDRQPTQPMGQLPPLTAPPTPPAAPAASADSSADGVPHTPPPSPPDSSSSEARSPAYTHPSPSTALVPSAAAAAGPPSPPSPPPSPPKSAAPAPASSTALVPASPPLEGPARLALATDLQQLVLQYAAGAGGVVDTPEALLTALSQRIDTATGGVSHSARTAGGGGPSASDASSSSRAPACSDDAAAGAVPSGWKKCRSVSMDVPVGMGPGDCGNGRSGADASRCTSFAYSSRRESFDLRCASGD
jgi:hypothetical protein